MAGRPKTTDVADRGRSDWIVVACAEHVRRGVAGGFMQVNHGKAAPLRRFAPGDRVAFYSPSEALERNDGLQSFSALCIVADGPIVQADTGDFHPYRRPVRFLDAEPARIRPLLTQPCFALSGPNWGAKLRFGLLAIDEASMDAIARAMDASGV